MTDDDRPRCYFAFRSPYSRLGLHKLRRAGVEPALHPFSGPPDGVAFQNPTDSPLKRAYYAEDVMRMTGLMGLPLAMPDPFDADFALADAVFHAADAAGAGMAFAIAASDARWGEGRDLSDPAVLRAAAEAAGAAPDIVDGAQESEAARAGERAARAAIARDGVFGVPFLVADGSRYWGQDRIDLYLARREAASA